MQVQLFRGHYQLRQTSAACYIGPPPLLRTPALQGQDNGRGETVKSGELALLTYGAGVGW